MLQGQRLQAFAGFSVPCFSNYFCSFKPNNEPLINYSTSSRGGHSDFHDVICSNVIYWHWSYQVPVIFFALKVHLNNEFKILLNEGMLRFGN